MRLRGYVLHSKLRMANTKSSMRGYASCLHVGEMRPIWLKNKKWDSRRQTHKSHVESAVSHGEPCTLLKRHFTLSEIEGHGRVLSREVTWSYLLYFGITLITVQRGNMVREALLEAATILITQAKEHGSLHPDNDSRHEGKWMESGYISEVGWTSISRLDWVKDEEISVG